MTTLPRLPTPPQRRVIEAARDGRLGAIVGTHGGGWFEIDGRKVHRGIVDAARCSGWIARGPLVPVTAWQQRGPMVMTAHGAWILERVAEAEAA